jgi:hypothetical protein
VAGVVVDFGGFGKGEKQIPFGNDKPKGNIRPRHIPRTGFVAGFIGR